MRLKIALSHFCPSKSGFWIETVAKNQGFVADLIVLLSLELLPKKIKPFRSRSCSSAEMLHANTLQYNIGLTFRNV